MKIKQIQNITTPIFQKAGIKRSSIFGSFVRGEQTAASDIDIIVDFPRGKGLFEFAALQLELEKALGQKVDLLTYDSINPLLKDRILAEQVILYEER